MRGLIASALMLLPAAAWAQNPMFDSVNGVRSVIHADPTGVADSTAAINTALTADAQGNFHNVYLPAGIYKIKGPLTISAGRNTAGNITGQCLFSDNNSQATLHVSYDYASSAPVIYMTGNAYGTPCIKDINITFDQPSPIGSRSNFDAMGSCGTNGKGCQYPPAIDITAANNTVIEGVWIGNAWDCINAAWNGTVSNGRTDLLNVSCGAFDVGLKLNGSLGQINVTNYHFFPWGITPANNAAIYQDGGTYAAYLTSDQAFAATNFFSQYGRVYIYGVAGSTTSWADFANLAMDGANATLTLDNPDEWVTVSGGYSTGTDNICQIEVLNGGSMQVTNHRFGNTATSTIPMICQYSGALLLNNNDLTLGGTGTSAITQNGGSLAMTGNRIDIANTGTWTVPIINQGAGGNMTMTGNQIGMLAGSGIAISATDVATNTVVNNTFGTGWTFTPPGAQGSYAGTTWASYTPTVTCSTGSLGAYTATETYQRVGKQVQLHGSVTLTTLGTCADYIAVSNPLVAASDAFGSGREQTTGTGLQVLVQGGSITILKYDGTFVAVDGYHFEFSANYVAQ